MGVLASTQRVPLPVFQSYQSWLVSDAATLLARFERHAEEGSSSGGGTGGSSFGFRISLDAFTSLLKDMPAAALAQKRRDQLATANESLDTYNARKASAAASANSTPAAAKRTIAHTATPATGGVTLPPIQLSFAAAAAGSGEEKESSPSAGASHRPSVSFHGPLSLNSPASPSSSSSGSPTAAAATAAVFRAWLGSDTWDRGTSSSSPAASSSFAADDGDEVDFLSMLAAVTVLARGRFHEKLSLLFLAFDFDEDGILSRKEMQALVQAVSQGLYRVYGVGIAPLPGFLGGGGGGGGGGTGAGASALREPSAKQCERWNESFVRKFESSLRTGLWNLEGFCEWAESSPLAVHLLCGGSRTPAGTMNTTDALKIVARIRGAAQGHTHRSTHALAGSGSQSARGGGGGARGKHAGASGTAAAIAAVDDTNALLMLGNAAGFDRSANLYALSPRSAKGASTPREPPVTSKISSPRRQRLAVPAEGNAAAAALAVAAPTVVAPVASSSSSAASQSSSSSASAPSAPSAAAARFKFLGKGSLREVRTLKQLFDTADVDSSGHLSLDYLCRPKKHTDPFLLRDVTAVCQEWKGGASKGPTATTSEAGIRDDAHHPSHASAGAASHRTEVTFSELLDILYPDLTPASHALLHSWVPTPITKDIVRALQGVFDRLDTDFTGKVKFSKILAAFKASEATTAAAAAATAATAGASTAAAGSAPGAHASFAPVSAPAAVASSSPSSSSSVADIDPVLLFGPSSPLGRHFPPDFLRKLLEPFVRLRPHRLEIAITIRELLTALFHRSHPKQLRRIVGWSKPGKALSPEQQEELRRLFQVHDRDNEGRFPIERLRKHLLAAGMPPSEIHTMLEDVVVVGPTAAAAAAAAATSGGSNGALAAKSGAAASDTASLMITLQEFILFYRDLWDSFVNYDSHCLSYEWSTTAEEANAATAGNTRTHADGLPSTD